MSNLIVVAFAGFLRNPRSPLTHSAFFYFYSLLALQLLPPVDESSLPGSAAKKQRISPSRGHRRERLSTGSVPRVRMSDPLCCCLRITRSPTRQRRRDSRLPLKVNCRGLRRYRFKLQQRIPHNQAWILIRVINSPYSKTFGDTLPKKTNLS